ncbi:Aldo-keto reductase [Mycena chlorophos]|uniref:Aldo-keto reductase n=1 Tax=Mycena chlorophos TaxID=658473 RepID=A0A8H6SWC6_MYCCL|nr:Aldo-keto reductase [Mycena chlorophos]
MSLPTRKIGGAVVSEIGFGAMGMSAFYGAAASDEDRFKLLDAAYESGCRNWDTAHIYGDSEEVIGKWFKRTGKRNEIFLATKFGIGPDGPRSDPAFIREQVQTSLTRLGVDYIDLYYQHRVDPKTPIEVTVGTMAELVKEGKVKYLGLSECSAKALRRAHAVHPISALQIEYSPFVLDIEFPSVGLLDTARELGVTIVAYSPLGRGLLTGRYNKKSPDDFEPNDFRRTVPKYSAENFPKILDVVSRLEKIGEKHNASAAQVTLAWILAQGPEFVLIPGTKSVKASPLDRYLKENIGASSVKLSKEEIAEVRKIAEESEKSITGTRYEAKRMQMLLLDSPELEK